MPNELSLAFADIEGTTGVILLAPGSNRVLFTRLGGERRLLEAKNDATQASVVCEFSSESIRGITEVNGRAYVVVASGDSLFALFAEPMAAGQSCEKLFEASGTPLGLVSIPNGVVIEFATSLDLFDVRSNTRSSLLQLEAGHRIPNFYLYPAESALVLVDQNTRQASAELVAVAFDGSNRRTLQKYGNVSFDSVDRPQVAVGKNTVYVSTTADEVLQLRLDQSSPSPKTIGLMTGDWGTFESLCAGNSESVYFKTGQTRGGEVQARWLERSTSLFQQVATEVAGEGSGIAFTCVLTERHLWIQSQSGALRRIQLK